MSEQYIRDSSNNTIPWKVIAQYLEDVFEESGDENHVHKKKQNNFTPLVVSQEGFFSHSLMTGHVKQLLNQDGIKWSSCCTTTFLLLMLCFIHKRMRWWSTRHTRQEQESLASRFLSYKTTRPSTVDAAKTSCHGIITQLTNLAYMHGSSIWADKHDMQRDK